MLNSGLLIQKETKNVQRRNDVQKARFFIFFRESVCNFLSKISANRTVGFLRAKKESCSTRREQCVGTGFLEFRQTP